MYSVPMRKVWLVILALLAGTAVAKAETIALLPAQGINVESGTLDAARDILEGDLVRGGRAVIPVGDPTAQGISPELAVRTGQEAKADFAAVLHLTRLGTSSRARLVVYRVPSGETVYSADLTATSADDLNGVLERLALGFGSNTSPAKTAALGNLTEAEAAPPVVHSVRIRGGASVLGLAAFNRPDGSRSAAAGGVNAFLYFDAEFLLWDASIDLLGHDGNLLFDLGVGVYYPLAATTVSPYIGGALRWSAATFGGAGASGISPEAVFGVIVGRTSSSQLRVQMGYFFDIFSEQPSTTYTAAPAASGSGTYVNGIIFSLGFCTRV